MFRSLFPSSVCTGSLRRIVLPQTRTLVCEVAQEDLRQLEDELKKDWYKTNQVRYFIKEVEEGRVQAKFITDGWPHFSNIVVAVSVPRLSEVADIYYRSYDKEKLVDLLREARLISWGKKQIITAEVEDRSCVDYLLSNLKPPSMMEDKSFPGLRVAYSGRLLYNPEDAVPISFPNKPLPAGYTMGHLKAHQASFIALHQDPPADELPNIVPYLDFVINNCRNWAMYCIEDLTKPVAWSVLRPDGRMGLNYTLKEHRNKGLGVKLQLEIMKEAIERGQLQVGLLREGVLHLEQYGFKEISPCYKILNYSLM